MAKKTARELVDRLVILRMLAEEGAAAVLASLGEQTDLNEDLAERDLVGWLTTFGVAVSVHTDDVDSIEDYYRYLLEERVAACTGGAVTVTDVELVRDEDDYEWLHFRRDGESVWWHVEHESDDYVDLAAVAEQINDLDPGGGDPRIFHHVRPADRNRRYDDVFVLASPEQASALSHAFGLDFWGVDTARPRRGAPPTAEPGTVERYTQEDRAVMTDPARAFLDRWLSGTGDVLDDWRLRFMPVDFPFDFSLDSLDTVGQLVLDKFADWSAVQALAGDPFVVGAVHYLGETLIRNAPGRWGYWDKAYHGVPLILSNTPRAFRGIVVPLHELSRVAEEREPGILGRSVEKLRHPADRYAKALRALS